MTWPAAIAILTGLAAAHLITHHQHRSTTPNQPTRRTENGHDPDQHHRAGEADQPQDDREEDDHRPPGP